jgi:hypothetical protein
VRDPHLTNAHLPRVQAIEAALLGATYGVRASYWQLCFLVAMRALLVVVLFILKVTSQPKASYDVTAVTPDHVQLECSVMGCRAWFRFESNSVRYS